MTDFLSQKLISVQAGLQSTFLELRQYKNDSTQSKNFLVLKLQRFFTIHIGDKAISKQESFLTELSHSYIVLALGHKSNIFIWPFLNT